MRARYANWKIIYVSILCCLGCNKTNSAENGTNAVYDKYLDFKIATEIQLDGYSGNAMEPFISADGQTLYFNNLNAPPENTNLLWAQKIGPGHFVYKGEIKGVNASSLEAVASIDSCSKFYLISTRSYFTNLKTVYVAGQVADSLTQLKALSGAVVPAVPGYLTFDAAISYDCEYLFYSIGKFSGNAFPDEADIMVAEKGANDTTFVQSANQTNAMLTAINTEALEYAACPSYDLCELYFTRADVKNGGIPTVYRTARTNKFAAFETPIAVPATVGFTEAPTLTKDGKTLYFHKSVNGIYKIFYSTR